MSDLEREARQWLARYREEERPPPEVDVSVHTRIQQELRGDPCALRIGRWAVAAAAILLILWSFGPRGSSLRSGGVSSFEAIFTRVSANTQTLKERSVQATPTPDAVEKYAAHNVALLEARRHIDAGDPSAALALLRPCPQKVGTDALLEDCELLVIEAMCRSGDLIGGRRQIALFREYHPDSIYTARLSDFCRE